jgi:threonine aldolase
MKTYDLRSDTITKPTEAMRKAMAKAEVGDDVYYEDPTVNRLEAMSAQLLGKEAALFVSSGSMGNLIPLFVNAGRGTEILTHANSHIIQHEVGAVSALAGVLPIGINAPRGILTAEVLEQYIKPLSYDLARTAMIEVEHTIGGICYPLATLQAIRAMASRRHLSVHMDGARLWNAVVSTGIDAATFADQADTVTFCISKGLGAPVGSVLCGDAHFIGKARAIRKMLGGGMRQAGILAAAGIYALEHHVARLSDDHEHARRIAETLAQTGWAQLTVSDVETNIIFFSVHGTDASSVVTALARKGIRCSGEGETIRLVTNLDLSDEDTDAVCHLIGEIDPKEFTS